LRKFKLQQYANKLAQQGYEHDVYKLAFLSYRERDSLMEGLNMLPGHQQRMVKLFKLVETLNPKQQLRQTLANAVKKGHTTTLAYQRSNSREALS
jgi:hypothetical protein